MEPAVDTAIFRALQSSAGREFVAELVDAFLDDAPKMLSALAAASASANVDAFRRTAHSLKSNSLTFGASTLGAMARELELTADVAVQRGVDALAPLTREYERAAAALTDLRNG